MTCPTSTCTAACKTLWQFPADPSTSTYNQNQKLLPTTTTGVTTFTPTGVFGLFSGGGTDVNFSDDGLNVGHTRRQVAPGIALPARHARLPGVRPWPCGDPQHLHRRHRPEPGAVVQEQRLPGRRPAAPQRAAGGRPGHGRQRHQRHRRPDGRRLGQPDLRGDRLRRHHGQHRWYAVQLGQHVVRLEWV